MGSSPNFVIPRLQHSRTPLNTPPVFEAQDLVQRYDQQTVLNIKQLSLFPKKIYCFYGPNGAGKTTLFELLMLLRKPSSGRLFFQGKEIYPQDDGLRALRNQVTLVHQDPLLFDTNVERNVDYGLRVRKADKELRKARVKECLALVGLDGFQHRKARQLSGGETQRVAIARALSIHPTVLFLDEFSANVDEKYRALLENILHKIREQLGTTIIFTTHYREQAYRVADEVIHLFRGRVVQAPLKNIFHGRISRKNDLYSFSTGKVKFDVITEHDGDATVAIPSKAIVVSRHPIVESSMRNHITGNISHIIDAGDHIDLNVQAGEDFKVTLSKDSYHEMQLHPGMQVFLNFKAAAVKVF